MHIHLLGICGTFMGGLANLAQQAGHTVSGQDKNVYPPMSTQLEQAGINIIEGFVPSDLPQNVDIIVVGNVMSRGMPIIEHIIDNNLPFISGPEFLYKYLIHDKYILAVAGTHGKTTTSSMLTWILEYNELNPGFLIGGVPNNFNLSAKYTASKFFVLEADEYDCAFFDKRSKFVHYHPNILVINNIEFDHADIFDSLKQIIRHFNQLLRILPRSAHVIYNANCPNTKELFKLGIWSEQHSISSDTTSDYGIDLVSQLPKNYALSGEHNKLNALAAIAAAANIQIPIADSLAALNKFTGVKRRLEFKGKIGSISVFLDFAHHPTAIKTTIEGFSKLIKNSERLITIVELGSNTMKMGHHQHSLLGSVEMSCQNYFISQANTNIELPNMFYRKEDLLRRLMLDIAENDQILIMTNTGFAKFAEEILEKLADKFSLPIILES